MTDRTSRWMRYAVCVVLSAVLLVTSSVAKHSAPSLPATLAIAPRLACEELSKLDLTSAVGAGTTITRAQEADKEAVRYCIVEGTIQPEIRFEVRLPTSGWTGRYLQTGCGGLCGMLNIQVEHADGCLPVTEHRIVLASTDMGHAGMGGEWAERNPAARADFGYRGVHLTAIASRALIKAYYGRAPSYSYFSGCSDGGREALIEAQRYPQDFDGIAAGAAALNFTVQNSFYHAWNARSNSDNKDQPILTAAQLPILHHAVVEACDELDGSKDGLIDDPRRCHFDPGVLQCAPNADVATCLTQAQVEVARKIYAGASDANGKKLVVAGPMPGSELSWAGVFVPERPGAPIMSRVYAVDSLRYLMYEKPLPATWSLNDFEFSEDTLHNFKMRGLYDATDPDLTAFQRRNGKLLMWHGWSDQHISPINSIAYYEAVARKIGAARIRSFARLFLIPGLYHCTGGEGPTQFDVLSALMDWVEHGKAPQSLMLNPGHPDHVTASTSARPVYAYPDTARRKDQTDDGTADTYERVQGSFASQTIEWAGASFFTSGYEIHCDSGLPRQCAAQSGK